MDYYVNGWCKKIGPLRNYDIRAMFERGSIRPWTFIEDENGKWIWITRKKIDQICPVPTPEEYEATIRRKTEENSAALGLPPMVGDVEKYPYAKNLRLWLYSQPDREINKALYAAYDVRRLEYCRVVGQDRDKMESGQRAQKAECFRAWLRDHDDAQWWGRRHSENGLKKLALEYFDQILQTLAQDTPPAGVTEPDDTI